MRRCARRVSGPRWLRNNSVWVYRIIGRSAEIGVVGASGSEDTVFCPAAHNRGAYRSREGYVCRRWAMCRLSRPRRSSWVEDRQLSHEPPISGAPSFGVPLRVYRRGRQGARAACDHVGIDDRAPNKAKASFLKILRG